MLHSSIGSAIPSVVCDVIAAYSRVELFRNIFAQHVA